MQKIIMLSECDGCIFTSPVSELVIAALLGKSKAGIIPNLYQVDDAFYMAFRADMPDFQAHPILVSFIQANIGKTILVSDFTDEDFASQIIGQRLTLLKLINEGVDEIEAVSQALLR